MQEQESLSYRTTALQPYQHRASTLHSLQVRFLPSSFPWPATNKLQHISPHQPTSAASFAEASQILSHRPLRPFFLSSPPLRRTRDPDAEEGPTQTAVIPVTLSLPHKDVWSNRKRKRGHDSTCSSSTSLLAVTGNGVGYVWMEDKTLEQILLPCALTRPVTPGSFACFTPSCRPRSVTSFALQRR